MNTDTPFVMLLLGASLLVGPCQSEVPAMEVRQVIIRAPELEIVKLTSGPNLADDELAARLWQAVKDGRASVVSDVSSAADDQGKVNVKSGQFIWQPTEVDQEFDWLYMVPVSFEERFIGTSLECSLQQRGDARDGQLPIRGSWMARFSPCGPTTVQWPTSWLNIYDHQANKVTDKAVHGWLDWRDVFEESLQGEVSLSGDGYQILAILPPGDQAWPGDGAKAREGRWLDVILAKADLPAAHTPARDKPPAATRTLFYGIATDAGRVLELMTARDPENDEALLQKLLAEAGEGKARMVLCAGSANDRDQRSELMSARWHQYPTEMPSIPSAWGQRAVGTALTMEGAEWSLTQALAPPARSEWKLAHDVPEAVMWQPRFRDFQVRTQLAGPGTQLVSLLQVPEVLQGNGLPKGESILVFARQAGAAWPESMPVSLQAYEAEMMVIEVPASEEADWQPADENAWHEPDAIRYQKALDRVRSDPGTLTAHMLLNLQPGSRSTSSITEDYPTATEFDPPHLAGSPRMRPTALEELPVGTRWELEFQPPEPGERVLLFTHSFLHSTTRPAEPGLAETLAIAATSEAPAYPGAVHLTETWMESNLKLEDGKTRCLGVRKPEGIGRDVRHVAFLRVRKVGP